MKNVSFFLRCLPWEKVVIFAKIIKSMYNVKIRVVSLFYKMSIKLSKNLFNQNRPIFTRGGQVVCTTIFDRYLC